MEEQVTERLKYHVIINDESKIFAHSLEEAQAFAATNAEANLSMKIETVTGVGSGDTWVYDFGIGQWKHLRVSSDE
jgi:hypothetical protein